CPQINVADVVALCSLGGSQSSLLLRNKGPLLIELQMRQGEVAYLLAKEVLAGVAETDDQAANCVPMDAGNALGRSDRATLKQELQDGLGRLDRKPHRAKLSLGFFLNPGFTADKAVKSLVSVAVFPVFFDLIVPTGGGYHGESAFPVGAYSLELCL
ncbi:MAG: hypothetical protein ABFC88_03390, partial [Thermoguttaceae bacterium]